MVRLSGTGVLGLGLLMLITVSGVLFGCPSYHVYS